MVMKHIFSVLCLLATTFAHHPNPIRPQPSSSQVPNFSFHELYNLTNNFMEQLMYPNNVAQAASINSTVFSPDVLGRVDVTRDFAGRELNTEYIYGLFANIALNPDSFTLLGYPLNYTITHFTANQNIASLSTIVFFNFTASGTIAPVEIDVWFTFNAAGQVSQYDATFRYLQWLIDSIIKAFEAPLGVNSTAAVTSFLQAKLAQSICTTAQTFCNGTNQQYASFEACEDFLINDVRFGQTYEWGMSTVACRGIHQSMVPLRPDVHCAHIGPSGGGYCTDDRTYFGTVLEPYFVNAPFVPYGKGNSTL